LFLRCSKVSVDCMLDAIRPAASSKMAESRRGARGGPSGLGGLPVKLKLGMEAQAAAVMDPAS